MSTQARDLTARLPPRYRLHELIGEGGMGRVYRAHDTTLGRDVAIKLIERDLPAPDGRAHAIHATQQRERFVREARAAARLDHPNIVAVHDVDPEAGWLVMALVDGKPLPELPTPITPVLCRRIAEQVLAGLAAAHAAGVIHRDVKPSNIVLGDDGHVTLVDFGVARLADRDLTQTGESLGTPAYMAPEQIRGATVDARADLYGLGATLYELVTGEQMYAFESPGPQALAKIAGACGDDARLARVIESCLQADPAARLPSADAALAVLAGRIRGRSDHRPRRRRGLAMVIAMVAITALVIVAVVGLRSRGDAPRDPRLDKAFQLAQRGEYESAAGVLDDYLGEHPDDSEALTLKLLCDWWEGGMIQDAAKRAGDARLAPPQRAMIHGIGLISVRRETEAVGYLMTAEREHPGAVEIVFALGEAQWHSQQYEAGAVTLERAFLLDPRWQMALHHVIEFRLSRGEAPRLRPIAAKLRELDGAAAAGLDCKIAIGERAYDKAVVVAQAALLREDATAELYVCLAQALALAGDLDAAERAATRAFELWPVDLREWGGFVHRAEILLYRGKLDEYLALVREKPSRQRVLALAMWRPNPTLAEVSPVGPGMRMPPLGAAVFVLLGHIKQHDETAVYADYPELEVRAYGLGLAAERRGDHAAAATHYRTALTVPAKGDLRMLVAHHLARALRAAGDPAAAATACREVIEPTLYQPYRAIVLPDCLLWSDDSTRWRQLVDAWQGTFDHPAVVEARRRL